MNFQLLIIAIMVLAFSINVFFIFLRLSQLMKAAPLKAVEIYNISEYEQSKRYLKNKYILNLVWLCVQFVIVFIIVSVNILKTLYSYVERVFQFKDVYLSMITLGAILIVYLLVFFIFNYVEEFIIEEKYGFNKNTTKTFIKDKIKVFVFTQLFLLIIVYVADDFLGHTLSGTSPIIANILAIAFIVLAWLFRRIFNKFTKMPEGNIKDLIKEFSEKHNFKFKNVYIMDASKRTTKVNAYFVGFGKFKKIVLYDTLLNQLTDEEILFVFAHEVGHAKHHDSLKLALITIPLFLTVAYFIYIIHNNIYFFTGFSFEKPNIALTLFTVFSLSGFMRIIAKLIKNPIIRRMEYQADRFAALNVNKEAAINATKELGRKHLSDINPHPVDVFVNYSHPTTLERISAIEKI